ncbi:MAG: ribonuclease HII [Paenisporosarcina sp.]
MKTIQEIAQELKHCHAPNKWTRELKKDPRVGVQQLIESWQNRLAKIEAVRKSHEEKRAFDVSFKNNPQDIIAGIDEAGRGPLAGPVVTAAVIFEHVHEELMGLNDSKQLSRSKRNEFALLIKKHAISYSIHIQSPELIDELNIYEATKVSMTQAVKQLEIQPTILLVDAMSLPLPISQHSIIKGDAKSIVIAAASILAKTTRDELMNEWDQLYPEYHFKKNAGYGTAEHLKALEQHGPTPIHRKSFEPIKSMTF